MPDDDLREPLRAYIYNRLGNHGGPMWFRKQPVESDEYSAIDVKRMCDFALVQGLEIRITNGGDHLVFHAKDGVVQHPSNAEEFWGKVGA